jgi:hypothetical protein
MGKQNLKGGRMRLFCLFMVLLWVGVAGTAFADGGRLVVEGPRTVGSQLTVAFDMGNYIVPSGHFVAINVAILESPEGPRPRIVPGYPKTSLVFEVTGRYVLTFRLSQISKSSCGGVDALPLMERTEVLEIAP